MDSGGAGMNTLKPCPFCGGAKICTEKSINLNYCDNCSAESNVEHWNTRPIEDALSKRIAELEDKDDIETEQKMTDKLIFTGKTILDMSKISYTLTADGYLVIFSGDSTIEIPIETDA
jgi:NMD protein affecting ribosome stability and mRNA decay